MKPIISKEAYEIYEKKSMKLNLSRMIPWWTFFYILLLFFNRLFFERMSNVFSIGNLISIGIKGSIMGTVFAIVITLVSNISSRKSSNIKYIQTEADEIYDLYVPCCLNTSMFYKVPGFLLIGNEKISFRANKSRGSHIEFFDFLTESSIKVIESPNDFITNLMVKEKSKGLSIPDDKKTYKFTVPYAEKIIDIMNENIATKNN